MLPNPWGLTTRECMVAWQLADHRVKGIARQLNITPSLVQSIILVVHAKMGTHHLAAAAVRFDRWLQTRLCEIDDQTVYLFEAELLRLERSR